MSTTIKAFTLVLSLLLAAGCASFSNSVKEENEVPSQNQGEVKEEAEVPSPNPGEVAVFGSIRLVEEIGVFLPNEDQDGFVYMVSDSDGTTYRVSCMSGGAFGVYLPAGGYKVDMVTVDGYTFRPQIHLPVPSGYRAVYAGVIELDGTPTGVDPATDSTVFVYSVLDESTQFAEALRKEAPGTELDVYKSLFVPDGSLATGKYPTKVFRAKDLEKDLHARTEAVEEVVAGGFTALVYCINPVWLLTMH